MPSRDFVWTLTFLLLAAAAGPTQAAGRVFHVVPEPGAGGAPWLWGNAEVARPDGTLAEVLDGRLAGLEGPVEIRLLVRRGAAETVYRRPEHGFVVAGWNPSSADARLSILGQKAAGLPLAVIEGPSLKETLCGALSAPRKARCERGEPEPELLLAEQKAALPAGPFEAVARAGSNLVVRGTGAAIAASAARRRPACATVIASSHVELRNLGFRDCWLAAVAAVGSRHVALRDSRILGSTFAFAAFPEPGGHPRSTQGFELTGNHWTQSPARYRPAVEPCDPERDFGCPVDIWSELPWGVTHHGFWNVLNGAFLGAKNIFGNVLIAGNVIEQAYNGIRVRADRRHCDGERPSANVGFEIRDNLFAHIRDNPIEPEDCADRWIVKHNRFRNVHAMFSTDMVKGGRMYVFGNVGWHDAIAGQACEQRRWSRLVRFRFSASENTEGLYVNDEDPRCPDAKVLWCGSHRRGTIVKGLLQDHRCDADPPVFFEELYVFNNSWHTRTPILAEAHASPLRHWNNAVEFAGCGAEGAELCRQESAQCQGFPAEWTQDRQALFADCFAFWPARGAHAFARDGFNRPLSPRALGLYAEALPFIAPDPLFRSLPAEDGRGGFELAEASGLRGKGCRPRSDPEAPERLLCADVDREAPVDIGAVQEGGKLFDVTLPFGFPFE